MIVATIAINIATVSPLIMDTIIMIKSICKSDDAKFGDEEIVAKELIDVIMVPIIRKG